MTTEQIKAEAREYLCREMTDEKVRTLLERLAGKPVGGGAESSRSINMNESGDLVLIVSITPREMAEDGSEKDARSYTISERFPEGFTFYRLLQEYNPETNQVVGYRKNQAVTLTPDTNQAEGSWFMAEEVEHSALANGNGALYLATGVSAIPGSADLLKRGRRL